MKYDATSTNILSRQLLLNIVRARHRDPIHFTGIANIAATYNFQMSAGMTTTSTGENGGLLTPTFGIGAAEIRLSALCRLKAKNLSDAC